MTKDTLVVTNGNSERWRRLDTGMHHGEEALPVNLDVVNNLQATSFK